MGYRSTFVTEDLYIGLPEWFYEKWKDSVHFGSHAHHPNFQDMKPGFPLSSKYERKFYQGIDEELFLDLSRFLRELKSKRIEEIELVLLHEDGIVDKVFIWKDRITIRRNLVIDAEGGYAPQLGPSETKEIK